MKKKPTHTQQLIEDIFIRYQCKSMDEAWRIYRQKYEVDKELDPRYAQVQNRQADNG